MCAVQLSRGVEHFATALQPFSISVRLVKMQKASPAHAPSFLMTVGRTPPLTPPTDDAPAAGAPPENAPRAGPRLGRPNAHDRGPLGILAIRIGLHGWSERRQRRCDVDR